MSHRSFAGSLLVALLILGHFEQSVASSIGYSYWMSSSGTNRTSPAVFDELTGTLSAAHCSFECSAKLMCYGFYWISGGLCGLFNSSIFWIVPWLHDNQQGDVYVRPPDAGAITKKLMFNCSQSSVYMSFDCTRAIDGNLNQHHSMGGFCIHTSFGVREWWQAHLLRPTIVSQVTIYNRLECCSERMNDLALMVDNVQCGGVKVSKPFAITNVSCWHYGSSIRIQNRLPAGGPINMCEVEVYGFDF